MKLTIAIPLFCMLFMQGCADKGATHEEKINWNCNNCINENDCLRMQNEALKRIK